MINGSICCLQLIYRMPLPTHLPRWKKKTTRNFLLLKENQLIETHKLISVLISNQSFYCKWCCIHDCTHTFLFPNVSFFLFIFPWWRRENRLICLIIFFCFLYLCCLFERNFNHNTIVVVVIINIVGLFLFLPFYILRAVRIIWSCGHTSLLLIF